MATDDDAIPGMIEEDVEVALAPACGRDDPALEPTAAQPAAPEGRATRVRLSAHDRPTGQFGADELARHTEVTTPGRRPRDTLELDPLAVEALKLLSKKDPEEVELLEEMLRESRRTPSR